MELLKVLSDMRRETVDMRDQANEALALAAEEAKSTWEGRVKQLERELMVSWLLTQLVDRAQTPACGVSGLESWSFGFPLRLHEPTSTSFGTR